MESHVGQLPMDPEETAFLDGARNSAAGANEKSAVKLRLTPTIVTIRVREHFRTTLVKGLLDH